jgi:hypothetical protein
VPIAASFHTNVSTDVLTGTEFATDVFDGTDFATDVFVGTDFAGTDDFSRAVLAPTATQTKSIVRKAARTVLQVYGTVREMRAQPQGEDCVAS